MICRPLCTSSDSLFPRVRDGWTIIEVLVTIAVISVLLSMSLFGLRGIRDKRDQIACLANIGGMGKILAAYGADNRDLFPSWAERGRDYAASDAGRRWWSYQPIGTLQSQRWLDYADFETTTEVMYCPANDWLPDMYEDQAAPDFVLSSAFYMTPSYLDPGLPRAAWHDRLGAQVQKSSAVRHPASKAGLFETEVWHGWRGVFSDGADVGELEYWQSRLPGSVFFIDGHAAGIYERDGIRPVGRQPVWALLTFGMTPWGVWGRDIE